MKPIFRHNLVAAVVAVASGACIAGPLDYYSQEQVAGHQNPTPVTVQSTSLNSSGNKRNAPATGGEVVRDSVPAGFNQANQSPKTQEVTIDKYDLKANVAEDHLKLIERKKEALKRYLFEKQELEDLREILSDQSRHQAFEDQKHEVIPVVPEEIRELRELQLNVQQATNSPVRNATLQIRTVDFDVESNESVDLLVSHNKASSIVFFDSSGNPWPVEGDVLGDQTAFKSSIFGESKHIIILEIMKPFSESNAIIKLKDVPNPVIVKLIGDADAYDSRLTVRIPQFGPNMDFDNQMSFTTHPQIQQDPVLLDIYNGHVQADKEFELVGVPGEAYLIGDSLYIRSKALLKSPYFGTDVMTFQGTNIYKVPPTPELTFSLNGDVVYATLREVRSHKQPNVIDHFSK
ncbi:DotH/IcmK family type IV secretion protein [Neptuniibacter sp. QD37_11]|uniref:DotH/IcmK family type IV secretion protein n=1 Tax=Neptuniibacter sp. QD37_11 TaxID=3398209 RepID=UPI0039F4CBA7